MTQVDNNAATPTLGRSLRVGKQGGDKARLTPASRSRPPARAAQPRVANK